MNIEINLLKESYYELKSKISDIDVYPRELINEFLIINYQFNKTSKTMGTEGTMGIFNQAFFDTGNIESAMNDTFEKTTVILEKRKKIMLLLDSLEEIRKEEPQNFSHACNVAIDSIKYEIKRAPMKPKITRDIERFFKKFFLKEKPNLIDEINHIK